MGQYVYSKNAPILKKDFNDYTVVGVKVTQRVLKDMLRCYAGIDNMLDEDYEESYGFPQMGRFFYGGFEFSF